MLHSTVTIPPPLEHYLEKLNQYAKRLTKWMHVDPSGGEYHNRIIVCGAPSFFSFEFGVTISKLLCEGSDRAENGKDPTTGFSIAFLQVQSCSIAKVHYELIKVSDLPAKSFDRTGRVIVELISSLNLDWGLGRITVTTLA